MTKLYLFTTATCPKCPMAKQMISDLNLDCEMVQADTDDGLELAKKFDIQMVPTFVEQFDDGQFSVLSMSTVKNFREKWQKN